VVQFFPDTVTCRYERSDGSPWILTRIMAEGGRRLKSEKASNSARHTGEWIRSTGRGPWSPTPPAWLLEFADQWSALFNDPSAWQG
jgi:hypothetical protein